VNGFRGRTSGRVQRGARKTEATIGAVPISRRQAKRNIETRHGNKKENAMLNKIAAALIASTFIAAPALAQTSGNNTSVPAAPAAQSQVKTDQATTQKVSAPKSVKHASRHSTKHLSKHAKRGKSGATHQARHVKPAKTHQVNAGKGASEPAKRS
jgi:hypothetical protein